MGTVVHAWNSSAAEMHVGGSCIPDQPNLGSMSSVSKWEWEREERNRRRGRENGGKEGEKERDLCT